MERTITAILTNSNDKKVFTSNANTLGELKAEMTAQGIDYAGMDFMEGLTHTTMMDDASILPSNVQYKGQTTNNLVFMLSTTNKNIRSGAYDRTELYAQIKKMNLQEVIKEKTGKNFTQVSSDILSDIVAKAEKKCEVPTTRPELYEYIKKHNLQETVKSCYGKNFTQCTTDALIAVCKESAKHTCACKKEKVSTHKAAPKKEIKSPYSDSELDKIIRGLRR